jgi:hypothetical protein
MVERIQARGRPGRVEADGQTEKLFFVGFEVKLGAPCGVLHTGGVGFGEGAQQKLGLALEKVEVLGGEKMGAQDGADRARPEKQAMAAQRIVKLRLCLEGDLFIEQIVITLDGLARHDG